jgi:hypothetical protein
MKTVWKWILGIFLALLIVAVVVLASFYMRGEVVGYRMQNFDPRGFSQRVPGGLPFNQFGHMRAPGMMSYGMIHGGGLFGGLLSLGLLALVVMGIIWLFRSLTAPKPMAAQATAPMVAATESPAEIASQETTPCKRCGKPLQEEWKVCPNCGKKV